MRVMIRKILNSLFDGAAFHIVRPDAVLAGTSVDFDMHGFMYGDAMAHGPCAMNTLL